MQTTTQEVDRVTEFCQQVKRIAATFKTFDEFFSFINRNTNFKKIPLNRVDFNRLVQVAAVEANLY